MGDGARSPADLACAALDVDRRRRRPVRLAITPVRGAGPTGALAAWCEAARAGARGVRPLPVPHLVAADSPSRPVLAPNASRARRAGGARGRLDAEPGLVGAGGVPPGAHVRLESCVFLDRTHG